MLASCTSKNGKYMACTTMFRGDVILKNVIAGISLIKSKKTVKFLDWVHTGFKVGINYKPPTIIFPDINHAKVVRACAMLSNTTLIADKFSNMCHKFDILYQRRSFIHYFVGRGTSEY